MGEKEGQALKGRNKDSAYAAVIGRTVMAHFPSAKPCSAGPALHRRAGGTHSTMSFQEEFRLFLKRYGIYFDERYVRIDHVVAPLQGAPWWGKCLFPKALPWAVMLQPFGLKCRNYRSPLKRANNERRFCASQGDAHCDAAEKQGRMSGNVGTAPSASCRICFRFHRMLHSFGLSRDFR